MKLKSLLLASAFLMLAYSCQTEKPSDKPVVDTFVVPASKAYAEPFVIDNPNVGIPVGYPRDTTIIAQWTGTETSVVWYLYQKEGNYDFFIDNVVDEGKKIDFNLSITECYDLGFKPESRKLTFNGKGVHDTVFCANVNVLKTGYYRYELKPTSSPDNAIELTSLLFNALTENGQVNHTTHQGSPSVHLSFSTTEETTKSYDWIYEEVMVPEGGDPWATFYMSLGYYRGYLGMQTNSDTERRVLFSVWDNKDADHDESMVASDFVSLVDKSEQTTVNSFGAEGTGGQSYINAGWETGKPVKFIMNVKPSTNGSVIYSAWYMLDSATEWQYIASWRAPKEDRMFDGFYSFIENFWGTNGHLQRKGYYYNAWGREDATGKWVNFNKVSFSNTDGAEGQRVDFEQGVSPEHPDKFYMASGAYTPTVKTEDEMALQTVAPEVDLSVLEARIAKALENEPANRAMMQKKLDEANKQRQARRDAKRERAAKK